MDTARQLLEYVLHIENYLDVLIRNYGMWIYALMFLVIFCETGLVVTPILPGDSLLFALGTFAATNSGLNLPVLIVLLSIAAILGDSINYWIGSLLGPRIFRGDNVRFLNRKHLERTHEFYERYGGKTIILARFVPIVRTFAPFVAGMGRMTYRRFMAYNVIGGIVWITSFLVLGYSVGNIPWIKANFSRVVLVIIVVSVLPIVVEFIRERRRLRRVAESADAQQE